MAFDIVFSLFVVAMLVLAVFVTRFAIQLNRRERPTRRRMPPGGPKGPPA